MVMSYGERERGRWAGNAPCGERVAGFSVMWLRGPQHKMAYEQTPREVRK
jgi:hypothetical protein